MRPLPLPLLPLLLLLLLLAHAAAAQLFVSPTGSPTSSCAVASPCTLTRALALAPLTDATIRVLEGTYVSPAPADFSHLQNATLAGDGSASTRFACASPAVPFVTNIARAPRDAFRVSGVSFVACALALDALANVTLDDVVFAAASADVVLRNGAWPPPPQPLAFACVSCVFVGNASSLVPIAAPLLHVRAASDAPAVAVLVDCTIANVSSSDVAVAIALNSSSSAAQLTSLRALSVRASDPATGCRGGALRVRAADIALVDALLVNNTLACAAGTSLVPQLLANGTMLGGGAAHLLGARVALRGVVATDNVVHMNTSGASTLAPTLVQRVVVGGGAVLVGAFDDSVDVVVSQCVFARNRVARTSLVVLAQSSHAGGGSLALLTDYGSVRVSVDASSFDNESVACDASTAQLTAASSNFNGGGALYVLATLNASVALSNVSMSAQVVNVSASVAAERNVNGGGAVYVYARGAASVRIGNGTRILAQVVDAAASAALNNLNGGGALLLSPLGDAELVIDGASVFDAQVLHAEHSSASGSNFNGGGGVYVHTLASATISIAGASRFAGQAVHAAYARAALATSTPYAGGNANGGAGIYVFSGSATSVTVGAGACFANQSVLVDANVSPSATNANGGGALFVYANASSATVEIGGGALIANQSVLARANSGAANYNGGGGVFVFTNVNANLTLRGATIAGQRVDADANNASVANAVGGGAVYLFALLQQHVRVLDGARVVGQVVRAADAFAPTNLNGGGAMMLNPDAAIVLEMRGASVVAGQQLLADNAVAITNSNGGAGFYLSPNTNATIRISDGCTLGGQVVWTRGNVALGGSNFNGGAAVYVNSFLDVDMRVDNATLRDNVVYAGDNVVYSALPAVFANVSLVEVTGIATGAGNGTGNVNGGGAFYLYATGSAFVAIDSGTTLENQAVHAPDNVAVNGSNANGGAGLYVNVAGANGANVTLAGSVRFAGQEVALERAASLINYCGGAGVYVLANAAANVAVLDGCVFHAQRVHIANATASLINYNGGAGLYVNSYAAIGVRVADSEFSEQQVNASGALAGTSNFNGGAAIYINPGARAAVSLANATLVQQALGVAGTVAQRGSNFNGGAGVYLLSPLEAIVSLAGGTRFENQTLDARFGVAWNASNSNGGAGLYLYSDANATLTLDGAVTLGFQSVNTSGSVAERANINGGGAVYVYAVAAAFVQASAGATLHDQSVECSDSVSRTGSQFNGGGGMYVSAQQNATTVTLNGTRWLRQTVRADRCVCRVASAQADATNATNFNGGAALYVNSILGAVGVSVTGSSFTDQAVSTLNNTGERNANGGVALYTYARMGATVGVQNTVVLRQTASLIGSVAVRLNSNGGGGVYVATERGPALLSLANVQLFGSSVDARGSVAGHATTSGGGALYINAGTDGVLSAVNCTFAVHAARLEDALVLGGRGVFVGGGAAYVLTSGNASVTLLNTTVGAAAVVFHQSTALGAGNVYGGGGALVVNARDDVAVVLDSVSLSDCVTNATGIAAPGGSVFVGGAVYALSRAATASVVLRGVGAQVLRSALQLSQVTAAGLHLAGVCGGASVFVLAPFNATALVSGAALVNSTLSLGFLQAEHGDWYAGSAGVLAVSTAASASATLVNSSFAGLTALVAAVYTAERVVAGGGAVLVVGDAVANGTFDGANFTRNAVSLRSIVSADNAVVAGGGGATLAAVNPCQTALMLLRVSGCAFESNSLTSGAVSGPESVIGGGALSAASAYAQLGVSIASSSFVGNAVLRNALDTFLLHGVANASANGTSVPPSAAPSSLALQTLGGGAVLVQSLAILQSEDNRVRLVDLLFRGNTLTFNTGVSAMASLVHFSALGGGGLLLDTALAAQMARCTFVDNSALASCGTCAGGAALLSGPTSMGACVVRNNAAAHGGGLALLAATQLSDTLIANNDAFVDSGGLVSTTGASVLLNCTVSGNTGLFYGGGVSSLLTASLTLNGSRLVGNMASSGGGAMVADAASLSIVGGSYVAANEATVTVGGCVAIELTGALHVDNSTLELCRSAQGGGGVAVSDSGSALMTSVQLRAHSTPASGGCILASGQVSVSLVNTTLRECVADESGGGIAALLSAVLLAESVVVERCMSTGVACTASCGGGGVYLSDSASLRSTRATVANCSAFGVLVGSGGGGVLMDTTASWSLAPRCTLQTAPCTPTQLVVGGNSAASGDGGGLLLRTRTTPFVYDVVPPGFVVGGNATPNVEVLGNVAVRGGGLTLAPPSSVALADSYLGRLVAVLRPWQLADNEAIGSETERSTAPAPGAGGALFFDLAAAAADDVVASEQLVARIANASAELRVGQRAATSNAATGFGDWAASTWVSVSVAPVFVQAWPGGTASFALTARDALGQAMASLRSVLVEVECSECASALQLAAIASGGRTHASVSMTGDTNTTVDIEFVPQTGLATTNLVVFESWDLVLGECPPGSGPSGGAGSEAYLCQNCSQGLYSLNGAFACQPCPLGMLCLGGSRVYVLDNYWPLVTNVSFVPPGGEEDARAAATAAAAAAAAALGDGSADAVGARTGSGSAGTSGGNGTVAGYMAFRCPYSFCERSSVEVSGAVEGAVLATNASLFCSAGRLGTSPLCGECVPGYSEWSHVCLECTSGYNAPALAVQLAIMSASVVLHVLLAQLSLIHARGSIGIMLLVFVYQFGDLALAPFDVLGQFTGAFDFSIPPSQSLGCPFYVGDGYGSLVVALLTPLVYLVLLFVAFALHKLVVVLLSLCCGSRACLREAVRPRYQSEVYWRTFFPMTVNLFESVAKAAFNFLVCVPFVDVVFTYPTVSCGTAEYTSAKAALIVLLVLLCAGAPIAMALALWRYKRTHSGGLLEIEDTVGGIFAHYRPELFWWESVQLVRRAALLAVYVPLAGGTPLVAKAALAVTVMLFTILHIAVWPYTANLENVMEVGSLVVILTLVALGLALDSTNGNETVVVIVSVILVLTAVVLLAPMLGSLVRAIVLTCRGKSLHLTHDGLVEDEEEWVFDEDTAAALEAGWKLREGAGGGVSSGASSSASDGTYDADAVAAASGGDSGHTSGTDDSAAGEPHRVPSARLSIAMRRVSARGPSVRLSRRRTELSRSLVFDTSPVPSVDDSAERRSVRFVRMSAALPPGAALAPRE